ncbi:ACP S-malonyltransferase [Fontivita pretiosa]|uniref:ACP S-malonyltransferase n=1 Tax=Fontivita pretiosa TaxID=2989684 RepID=UPI003D162DB7
MTSKTYILCPGQGAQVVGMGKDFVEAFAVARDVFDRANAILGFDLADICFNGPEQRLNQTDIAQPAIYVTSVACFAAAREAGVIQPQQVGAYAGLSLGEYTALHLGGAFSFEDGLKLVAARGRYMQQAAVATPSTMVSLMGADEPAVIRLCDENAQGEVLVPANFNSPGQIVVSGAIGACQRLAQAAEAAGFKAIPLKVAGAFHSPLMQPAAQRMAGELEKVALAPPHTTVYANVTARPHTDAASIRRLLVEQIVKPVRWEQTMQELISHGEAQWIELAPGRVLSGLLKKINRRIQIQALSTADAVQQYKPVG